MSRIARSAPFAAFLGIDRAKAPARKAAPRPKVKTKPKAAKAAADTPAFAHLLGTPATTRSITPAERSAIRGAAARDVVAAYAEKQRAVAGPGARQTAPEAASPEADRDLAARIVAAGRKRRGEI